MLVPPVAAVGDDAGSRPVGDQVRRDAGLAADDERIDTHGGDGLDRVAQVLPLLTLLEETAKFMVLRQPFGRRVETRPGPKLESSKNRLTTFFPA